MFIPESFLEEVRLVGIIIKLLEDVFESAVILLQDGVLSTHVKRVVSVKSILE
jgi:hypothetical protein